MTISLKNMEKIHAKTVILYATEGNDIYQIRRNSPFRQSAKRFTRNARRSTMVKSLHPKYRQISSLPQECV